MQYKVTGNFVVFGAGIVIKLSKEQAKIRSRSLKPQNKDVYKVIDAVQFKNGEIITILSENISKAVLKNLESLFQPQNKEQNTKSSKAVNNPKKDNKKDDIAKKDKNTDQQNSENDEDDGDDERVVDNQDINNLPIR